MRVRHRWRNAINARLVAVEDATTILQSAVRDQAAELADLRIRGKTWDDTLARFDGILRDQAEKIAALEERVSRHEIREAIE